jgi:hypothetical protein
MSLVAGVRWAAKARTQGVFVLKANTGAPEDAASRPIQRGPAAQLMFRQVLLILRRQ